MRFFVLAAFLLFHGPAQAAPYFGPDQVDLRVLLPPPPVLNSDAFHTDLDAVLAAQATRTPEQAAQTVHDVGETVFDQFTDTIGPNFTPASLPHLAALFDRMGETEDSVVDPAKRAFARLRPFLASNDVHPSVPLTRSGSWPSGHATRVTMAAVVLAQMVPEDRVAIFARAKSYAWNRVVGGAHYPSDVVTGMQAGTAITAVLLHNPGFEADYQPARAELRQVLGLTD